MIEDGAASRIQEVSIKPESKCVFLVLPSKIFNRLLPANPEKKMPEVGLLTSFFNSLTKITGNPWCINTFLVARKTSKEVSKGREAWGKGRTVEGGRAKDGGGGS